MRLVTLEADDVRTLLKSAGFKNTTKIERMIGGRTHLRCHPAVVEMLREACNG
ncbi:MAG: hypothetical protein J0H31_07860 [Alphaproteobacteria bacterium]|nr:hypothetical protein [Alphaproteobacteria bacterium]